MLEVADLGFTSTWTNGPCPADTQFDAALARWDLRPPEVWYADYVPLQVDAWGEVEWYGRPVWKVQFTALECTTSGSVYGTEIEVRYLVCGSDGVRLAGVEYSYRDSSNDSFTVELYDPPPLLLPNDRTEGTAWSEEFASHAFWYNLRLYPDDEGYRDGTYTLTGTMGERAPIDVAAGTFDAQAVVVEGLPNPHNGSVREDEETHWAEGEGLVRWALPYFFVMETYELVGRGER